MNKSSTLRVLSFAALALALIAVSSAVSPAGEKGSKAEREAPSKKEPERVVPAVVLDIEGMTCDGCASRIRKILLSRKGVESAEVSFKEKRAVIALASDGPSPAELIEAVEKAGFRASRVELPEVAGGVVRLEIEGMTCDGCAAGIRKALVEVEGVESAKVSFADRAAWITVSEGGPSLGELVETVEKAGFKAKPVKGKTAGKEEQSTKQPAKSGDKKAEDGS